MKKIILVCAVICGLSCFHKRPTINSVPVLLNYTLYYPDHALERGLEGTVTLVAFINEKGIVERARVQQSSGYAILDSAALRTAETFQFSPARVNEKPVKATVTIPIDFRLREIDLDAWITEVKLLQKRIQRDASEKNIELLYSFYKKLIYSTRYTYNDDINDYISTAVLKTTAELWEGYWGLYPAASLLFLDIIERYPDSFISLYAEADFKKFFQEEAIRIHQKIPDKNPSELINRLYDVLEQYY